jgi:hypothetical protein
MVYGEKYAGAEFLAIMVSDGVTYSDTNSPAAGIVIKK